MNESFFDYVILTAFDEKQAISYQSEINKLEKNNAIPCSRYLVVADGVQKLGSGGATINALNYLHATFPDNYEQRKVLLIHSGGESQRLPFASIQGKIFTYIEREKGESGAITLFQKILESMNCISTSIPTGGVLIASGDVYLKGIEPLNYNGEKAIAFTAEVNVDLGTRHGVFVSDNKGNFEYSIQKGSAEVLRKHALNKNGNVYIDTGILWFHHNIIKDILSLNICEPHALYTSWVNAFSTKKLKPALGTDQLVMEKISYLLEGNLLKLHSFAKGEFYHIGTTSEYLSFVNSQKTDGNTSSVVINSAISEEADVSSNSFIENSILLGSSVIGSNCLISGAIISENVPSNTVIQVVTFGASQFVARIHGADDNPKTQYLFNISILESIEKNGLDYSDVFPNLNPNEPATLWNANIYPITSSRFEAVTLSQITYKLFTGANLTHLEIETWKAANKASLKTSFYNSSLKKDNEYNDSIYLLTKVIKEGKNSLFPQLRNEILSHFSFILVDSPLKDSAEVSLPARVNMGGGWTDTYPYCMLYGGNVLSLSALIDGKISFSSSVQRLDKLEIQLHCVDTGEKLSTSSYNTLIRWGKEKSVFSLPIAALSVCGIISPDFSLEERLNTLRGGLAIRTYSQLPQGSGLGGSSILAATLVKALSEITSQSSDIHCITKKVIAVEQMISVGGGWQDQVSSLTPRIKLLQSTPGLEQIIKTIEIDVSDETTEALNNRLLLIYSGERRFSGNLLQETMEKVITLERDAIVLLEKNKKLASVMAHSLAKGELSSFTDAMNKHYGNLLELNPNFATEISNKVLSCIDSLIESKMICGAGGGGYLQVFIKKDVSSDMIRKKLKQEIPNTEIIVSSVSII